MPPSGQDRLRQSWKLTELSGKPAQAWLIVRRVFATILAIGLIGYCGWLLLGLLWVPKSYLAYWSANAYKPLCAGPVRYACEDFAAIDALKDSFSASKLVNPAEVPLNKDLLEEQLRELASQRMRRKDTCVVFLTAHGGVRNQEAFLLCEPGDLDSVMPLSELLAALKNISAGTKLLILDAGRDEFATQVGMTTNSTFPALLEKAVKESNDPDLWVMCANGALERSHVSSALRRSIFGYMVSQGLSGAADRDDDRAIRLNELYNFVQRGVSAWVKMSTAAKESQTPQLFHADPEQLVAEQLASRKLIYAKKPIKEPEHTAEHVAAHEPESEGEKGLFGELVSVGNKDAKGLLPTEELELVSKALGIHHGEGDEEGPHAEHPGDRTHEGQAEAEHAKPSEHETEAKSKTDANAEAAANAVLQLQKAWRDISKLDESPNQFSPMVETPYVWREVVDRLSWCDQFCAAGVPANAAPPWITVKKQLDVVDRALRDFASLPRPALIHFPSEQPVSLALVEGVAATDWGKPLSQPMKDFLATYDGLLFQRSPSLSKDKLSSLLAAQKKESNLGLTNYYEFQLLDLRNDPEVSWDMLQLALRVRRIGEMVAMSPLCGEGWLRDTIEAADRRKGEGERLMLDRTADNWEKLAIDNLNAALAGYDSADHDLATVQSTVERRNHILARAPDLIRWARLSGDEHQEVVAIENLFSILEALNKELANPKGGNIDSVRHLRDQLQSAFEAVERKTDSANNAWRMSNLLATALPPPSMREKLAAELAAADQKQMQSFKVPESESEAVQSTIPTDEQWKAAVDEMELDIALARLAGCDEKSLDQLKKSLDGAPSERIEKLNEARGGLAELFDKLPNSISSIADSSTSGRPPQLAMLRSALPSWLLLGPQHREQVDPKNSLISKLDRATWYDLLAWNRNRYRHAAEDAPVVEEPFLHNASATFQLLANEVSEQPTIAAVEPAALSIVSPTEVSLVTADEAKLTFTVKSNVSEEKPIWLVAQYNDRLLDIGSEIYRQHDLPVASAASNVSKNGVHYPLRPDAFGLAATYQLPAGGSRDFTIKLKRQPNTDAGGTSKLILKAVSGDTFIRRELNVVLPGRESLDITVNAPSAFWTPVTRALHPLPNREQNFAFDVVNRAKVAKKLDVSICAPSRIPNNSDYVLIPTGPQKAETANKLLDPYRPLVELGPVIPIELPVSGESARIRLPSGDPKNNPQANLLLPEKADPEKFSGVPLRYGLIILLTDQQTKEVTIRRIEITPQRPRGYLDAVAHYDPTTLKIRIDVTARNRDVVPPGGLHISADVSGASGQLERSLKAELKEPSYAANLYAYLSPTASEDVTAYVNVDDYPRAFVFKFSRNAAPTDINPSTDVSNVRIVSPKEGTAYKAPVKVLPVTAQVDAPEGTFGDENTASMVEVGIDENEDRELEGEPVERRYSDRQVSVNAKGLSPNGALALDTRVSDFQIDLSTGLTDRKALLLGRLVINGKSTWSQPVEIVLDGSAPIIDAAVPPNREVESGEDLVVHILVRPNELDLSGVKSVEAVFDSIATKDSKPANWEEAVPDGDSGWEVKLSTKDMGLGPQMVLVRATVKVGNVSEPLREPVTIVPKSPKTAPVTAAKDKDKPDVDNIVSGLVQYGGQAMRANVTLESIVGPAIPAVVSDNFGKFSFPKVAPGKYKLKAKTLEAFRNRFRQVEMEIIVLPKPHKSEPITVKLQ